MNTDFWNRSRDGNNLWMCLKWNKKVAHILVWGRFGNFPYLILVNGSGWLITDYRASFCSAFLYTSRWSQSVQFSRSVMSNSLRPHEPQHARPPCPSPTPGVYSTSCPSSRWCHPAISSSVVPFSSFPQSLQHQGLFQWVNSSHQVAKVLEFQLQHQPFQWTHRTDLF